MHDNVEHAKRLDTKNENDFLVQAIKKEMNDVGITFEILHDDMIMSTGHKKITCYLLFVVKMDFTRKARWVLDGHKILHQKVNM